MSGLSCHAVSGIQWLGAGFAIAAALFWFWASITPVPNSIDTFLDAIRKQSRINAAGAICAAVAAALQAFLILQPACINF